MDDALIVSGSSNPSLARKLSQTTGIPLANTVLSQFPDHELQVRVEDKAAKIYLIQSFSDPVNSHIIEFMLLADAVHRLGAREITAIIPWYGYSRQDKVFLPGEPLSAKVIARLIQTSHIERLITVDLHNPSIAGYLDRPLTNIPTRTIMLDAATIPDFQNAVVVAPDAGSLKVSAEIARNLSLPLIVMQKSRNLYSGEVAIDGISDSIEGKVALMFDDMIATGSTTIKSSQYLKSKGASAIHVFATHHLYIPGVQEQLEASPIDSITVTDTIEPPEGFTSSKTKIISVAPLIAESL
jgi:ribose-phosphate pyrophosphokinase